MRFKAAKIGANRISPWPGARRFGSFTCTWPISPVGSHVSISSGTETDSLRPAALQSIIVLSDGRSIARTISAASATVLTSTVSLRDSGSMQ